MLALATEGTLCTFDPWLLALPVQAIMLLPASWLSPNADTEVGMGMMFSGASLLLGCILVFM